MTLLRATLVLALVAAAVPGAVQPVVAQDEPIAVSDAFEASGDAGGAVVEYAWAITQPGRRWLVELRGPGDQQVWMELRDADGQRIDRSTGTPLAALRDLALEPGTYRLVISRTSQESTPFELSAGPPDEAFDEEPNDEAGLAAPIVDDVEVVGRLAGPDSDVDVFRLSVPEGGTVLRDVRLSWSGELERRLCLHDRDDVALLCRSRDGEQTASLLDLALAPGDHLLRVSGSVEDDAPYRLLVETRGPRPADYEAEPNDDFATASSFDASIGVRGRSSYQDHDFHRASIAGEPQLWRVEASGPDIESLAWVRGDGQAVAAAVASGETTTIGIDDLHLVPGEHTFRVRALDGDYELTLSPLGPPDPDQEREPNSDEVRAEPYTIGERKVGRMTSDGDHDYFRVTLAAPEHLRLRLDQPPDADIEVRLHNGGTQVVAYRAAGPGMLIDLDLRLRPGDHLIELLPRTPSPDPYELTTERLDPFTFAADQEPNDVPVVARAAPSSLAWEGGTGGAHHDALDAYRLPPLEAPGPATIRLEPPQPWLRLYAGDADLERLDLEQQEDGSFVASDVPTGVPLYLEVLPRGDYRVALEAPGWLPLPEPAVPPIDVAIGFDDEVVAAYWPEAQRIHGRVTLDNAGPTPLDVRLEVVTSHFAWEAIPDATELSLEPGASHEVAMALRVEPDVWADEPVRVSVAVRTTDGGQVTAAAVVDAAADAAPVGAVPGWRVPDALLGGLNVAGGAIGGRAMGSVNPDREPFLYDGVTPAGAGFVVSVPEHPLELGVDLAGESPVSVLGTILNPLASGSRLHQTPRHFELLLSTDGATFEPVLAGELTPLPIDQAFVLEEPVAATHAMLRILSGHSDAGRNNVVALGEWKVIAAPGIAPDDMPTNIAHPSRGGHVARHAPFLGGLPAWYAMLDDETRRQGMRGAGGEGFEVVVGFQDGRAAQVTGMAWLDPEGSDEETRLDSVDVDVSVDGPSGPWQPLGTWSLARQADGSVVPFGLDTPVWARYVRFSAAVAAEQREIEAPARIEVFERPTDDTYRSILGEWGYTSPLGPWEWLVPAGNEAVELGRDAADTREAATPLPTDVARADQVEILEDVDWYRVDVPAEANTLRLDVDGVPAAGVRLSLHDAAGNSLETTLRSLPGGLARYEAVVEPGASYDLLVEQPPFNVAFTFDTSGSMGPFLDFVLEGVREFAADVEPGREVAMIIPFEQEPLVEGWADQPFILQDAVSAFAPGGSSSAEIGLLASMERLAERDGTRAILIVTDAETGSLSLTPDLWAAFDEVRPVVYAVHVGASGQPVETRHLMQSWAAANGGQYAYPTTHAEMDRAFERMSTRLRRPSLYTLTASTALVDRSPGSIAVVAPPGRATALAPGVGVEIILDTSASMRRRIDGRRRIAVAKASLRSLVRDGLAEGVPVALRSFGAAGRGPEAKCGTTLDLPLQPLDRDEAVELIRGLRARRQTATPIGAALAEVREDLAEVTGSRTVVLVTDGDETCEGDPAAVIAELQAEGIEVNLNIVGFALDDEALKAQMAEWAAAAGGTYFDAAGAAQLADAILTAVSAPFRVHAAEADEGAPPVARGTVGGDPVTLEPGTYRVEVLTDPPVEFERVELGGGQQETLTLPPAGDSEG